MNVFYTNKCAVESARDHNTKHRNKMIVEYTQVLSTAKRLFEGELIQVYKKRVTKVKLDCGTVVKKVKLKKIDWYKLPCDNFNNKLGLTIISDYKVYAVTHQNHPSAIWARESEENYNWLYNCTVELCKMFENCNGRSHKTSLMLDKLKCAPAGIPSKAFSSPPVVAPDEFKAVAVFQGAAVAYQKYLVSKFEEWLNRDKPIAVEFDYKPSWY